LRDGRSKQERGRSRTKRTYRMHDCPLIDARPTPGRASHSLVASGGEMVQSTQWLGTFAEIG